MRSRRLSKPPCPPPTVSCVAPVLRARHACVCAVLRARHACVCAATTWFLETDASSPRSLLVVAFASEDETMFLVPLTWAWWRTGDEARADEDRAGKGRQI
jgi:hypothetical protein